jgi:hypothetical protein
VFLQWPVKKHQTSVIDSYITLWCVLNAVCVLALPGKETAGLDNTFLHHPPYTVR